MTQSPLMQFHCHYRWNFHSEDGDIAFAVYKKRYNDLLPIVPHDRVACNIFPEEGEVRCDETGVCEYFFKFIISDINIRNIKI